MRVVESLSKIEVLEERKYRYSYKLIQHSIPTVINKEIVWLKAYGIEVERQDIVEGSLTNIERNSIHSISSYRYKVHSLLKLLYDNSVSPIHLVDIIGEKVDEYIADFNFSLENLEYELKETLM